MKHRRRTIGKHNRIAGHMHEAAVASSEAGKAVTESLGGGLDYSSALTSKRSRHNTPAPTGPDQTPGRALGRMGK